MLEKFKHFSIYKLFFLAVLIQTALGFLLNLIDYFLIHSKSETDEMFQEFMSEDPIVYILLTITIAPLVETLIFQSSIIELIFKVNNKAVVFAVFFSGIIFGLLHYYSVYYQISASIIGIFYACTYIFIRNYRKESAFLFVFLIHVANNIIATLLDLV